MINDIIFFNKNMSKYLRRKNESTEKNEFDKIMNENLLSHVCAIAGLAKILKYIKFYKWNKIQSGK